jgi:pyruvate dehydrogenase E2 component (dihydrolipoamide acetyltransferase)
MGMTMEEGIVSKWLVEPGTTVTAGQEILEFETDKINATVEAPVDGVLGGIAAQPGEAVAVQGLLAYILEPGEEPPAAGEVVTPEPAVDAAPPPTPAAPSAPAGPALPPTAKPVTSGSQPTVAPATNTKNGRIKSSPLARRIADELSVNLGGITGSGPGGRIIERDVRDAAAAGVAVPAMATATLAAARGEPSAGTTIPVVGVRKVIAERMTQSLHESAQLTLVAEADGTQFHALRTDLAAQHEAALGFKISYNDLLIRICARALQEHSRVNATMDANGIHLLEDVNIGLAVEAGQDLVVPNVKNAHRKSVVDIALDLRAVVDRAMNNQMQLDDITGGTFTITNLGLYGIDAFTPVINPPEAAILGVGQLREKAWAENGQVVARMSMTLSLTLDHRIVDGAPAARFLARVVELIEHPYLLI